MVSQALMAVCPHWGENRSATFWADLNKKAVNIPLG